MKAAKNIIQRVNVVYVFQALLTNTSKAIANVQVVKLMSIRNVCLNGSTKISRMKRLKYHIIVAKYVNKKSISLYLANTMSKQLVKFLTKSAKISLTTTEHKA